MKTFRDLGYGSAPRKEEQNVQGGQKVTEMSHITRANVNNVKEDLNI